LDTWENFNGTACAVVQLVHPNLVHENTFFRNECTVEEGGQDVAGAHFVEMNCCRNAPALPAKDATPFLWPAFTANPACEVLRYGSESECSLDPYWNEWAATKCKELGLTPDHVETKEACGANGGHRFAEFTCCP
jgi:hypothetical protein